jgi:hypothetical protein
LLFDDAAKIDEAFHLFKCLAFKLYGGCTGSVLLQYLALASVDVQTYLFSVFHHSSPAFAVGCTRGGLSHTQSPGHQAESKSAHCMPFCFCAVDVFMTQSMASRNKNSDINVRG